MPIIVGLVLFQYGSMVNKSPGTEIGVHPEDQKIKTASNWFLPLPQSEIEILLPGISEEDLESYLLPSLVLGLNV